MGADDQQPRSRILDTRQRFPRRFGWEFLGRLWRIRRVVPAFPPMIQKKAAADRPTKTERDRMLQCLFCRSGQFLSKPNPNHADEEDGNDKENLDWQEPTLTPKSLRIEHPRDLGKTDGHDHPPVRNLLNHVCPNRDPANGDQSHRTSQPPWSERRKRRPLHRIRRNIRR